VAYFQTGDLAQFQTGACTGRPLAVEFMLIFMELAARQLHGAPGMGAEREVKVHRGP
jgi:hypothetical protein